MIRDPKGSAVSTVFSQRTIGTHSFALSPPTFYCFPDTGLLLEAQSLCLPTKKGIVLAPEDERAVAEKGWADELRTFEGGSLRNLRTIPESVTDGLSEVKVQLGLRPPPPTLRYSTRSRNPERARQRVPNRCSR
jgi:hypothetical protein